MRGHGEGSTGSEEAVTEPGRVPSLPGPVSEVPAGVQGVGVLGAESLLSDGELGGEQVTGPGRVPRRPGPAGEAGTAAQHARYPARHDRMSGRSWLALAGRWATRPGALPATQKQEILTTWLTTQHGIGPFITH